MRAESTQSYIWLSVVLMLIFGTVVDFVCWKHRSVAVSIFYLECLWALFDAALQMRDYAQHPVAMNCSRLIAVALAFGVNAQATIVISLSLAAVTHISVQITLAASGNEFDTIGLVSSLLLVFIIVTAFWANLR